MDTVKYNEDIFSTLFALQLAEKYGVRKMVLIRKTKEKEERAIKDISTKLYLVTFFGIAERTALERISFLIEKGLAERDYNKSYRVSTPKVKTDKWVIKLTSAGNGWLKSNDSFFSSDLKSKLLDKFRKVQKTIK